MDFESFYDPFTLSVIDEYFKDINTLFKYTASSELNNHFDHWLFIPKDFLTYRRTVLEDDKYLIHFDEPLFGSKGKFKDTTFEDVKCCLVFVLRGAPCGLNKTYWNEKESRLQISIEMGFLTTMLLNPIVFN